MTICRYNSRVKLYKNLKFCRLSHARVLWAHFLLFPLILRKDSLTRHVRKHARTRCRFLCVHTLNRNIATMFFVCALVLTFLIKLRFPKGISIASVLIKRYGQQGLKQFRETEKVYFKLTF